MKIDILTLFPDMFSGFISESIIKRAIQNSKVIVNIHNIRDYSKDPHKKVDDYQYGGGAGMVLMCEPIFRAIEDIRTDDSLVIMMSPAGKVFKQEVALDLSKKKNLGSVIKASLCTIAILIAGGLYIYSIMATENALKSGFQTDSYSTMFDNNCVISIVVVCIAMASSLAGLILSFINYDRTYEKVDR